MNKFIEYLKSILIPVILGALVGYLVPSSLGYQDLIKPEFAPDGKVFGIVWPLLYILMGISYANLKTNDLIDTKVNKIYYIQLIVNLIWPILFFSLDARLLSFFWLLLLIILVINMIRIFLEKNTFSAILQIPYLLWLLFASVLNWYIYVLNM